MIMLAYYLLGKYIHAGRAYYMDVDEDHVLDSPWRTLARRILYFGILATVVGAGLTYL